MADENLQYELTFKTRAEGDGAQRVLASTRDLKAATDKLNSSETTSRTRDTAYAFQDLESALSRTTNTAAAARDMDVQAAASKRNFGGVVQQAGFQVQDFAVQVAAGGNAVNAFVQQGSQMLGFFGPAGALAGGLLALGGIAFNAFSRMGGGIESVMPKGEALNDLLNDIAATAAAASDDEIDFAITALKEATTQAAALRDRWKETNAAADKYEMSQLDNEEKLRQAALEWRKLRGEQVNALEEIAEREAADAGRRETAARLQAEAEQKRAADAFASLAAAQEELDAAKLLTAEKTKQLEEDRKALEQLRERRNELLTAATEERGWTRGHSTPGMPWQPTEDAKQARNELTPLVAELRQTAQRITTLEAGLAETGEITKTVEEATEKLAAAKRAADDIAGAVETETKNITASLDAENVKGAMSAASEAAAAMATEVEEGVNSVNASNEAQKQAKAELLKAAKDGQITVDEIASVSRNMVTLFGSSAAHLQSIDGSLKKLIDLYAAADAKISAHDRKIEGLMNPVR